MSETPSGKYGTEHGHRNEGYMNTTSQTNVEHNGVTGEVADPKTADATELASAAMVLRGQSADDLFRLEFEPRDFLGLERIAGYIAKTGVCGCNTIEQVIVRALTGRSLGLSLMQSIRGIYDIEGKPALDASLMHALCLTSPACVEFRCIATTEKIATYRVKRRGDAEHQDVSFTIEEAEAADLLGRGKDDAAKKKNNWNRWPRAMLRARAKSNAARMVFPEVLMGMYSGEELRDGMHPGEMEGEVVTTHERAKFSATAAAVRDHETELAEIGSAIKAALTGAEGTKVRERIEAWDAPESYRARARDLYNAHKEEMKAKAKEPKGSAPVAANGQGTLGVEQAPRHREPGED